MPSQKKAVEGPLRALTDEQAQRYMDHYGISREVVEFAAIMTMAVRGPSIAKSIEALLVMQKAEP